MFRINHRSDIKPIQSHNYILNVVDPTKGYFIVQSLPDGKQTPLYTDEIGEDFLFYVYGCFTKAIEINESTFDELCKMELNK